MDTIKQLKKEIKNLKAEAKQMHKEVCEEIGKEIPYNEEEDKIQWEIEEAQLQTLKDVLKLIDDELELPEKENVFDELRYLKQKIQEK